MNFKIKSVIFALILFLLSSCENKENEAIKRFGTISFKVENLGKELADDIYLSCIRAFEIENDIKEKTDNIFALNKIKRIELPDSSRFNASDRQIIISQREGSRNRFRDTEESEREEIVPPPRRSRPDFPASGEIPFPDRRSSPIDQDPTSLRPSKSFSFAPLRRIERCKNAELQSQITRSGFITLSEYGKLVYFLVSGDNLGSNNFINNAKLPTNGGQILTVSSPISRTQAERSLSNFFTIERSAQSLISLISNIWLAQVRFDELRPLVICRNEDVQTLVSTLNKLSEVFYAELVLNNEEELKKDYFELSYRHLQEALKQGYVSQSIFNDSVQSLTIELDKAMQDIKERKEKIRRLAGILENLAFYHKQAAILLSSELSDREIYSRCKEYDTARLNSVIGESHTFLSRSTKPQVTRNETHQFNLQVSPQPSNPLFTELTREERRELASVLSNFVKSID